MIREKFCKECGKKLHLRNSIGYCREHRNLSEEYKKQQREHKRKKYTEEKSILIKRQKDYYYRNKEIISEKQKKYREANKEKLAEYGKKYQKVNKEKLAELGKKYREDNKNIISEKQKKYREANRKELAEYGKKYREANRKELAEYRKKWKEEKREKDHSFKIRENVSRLVSYYMNKQNVKKESSTDTYVDIKEIVEHLESQFDEQMNWNNYGSYWEIDHVIPQSLFDFTNEDQIKLCWKKENLRPLSRQENASKSNKINVKLINEHNLQTIFKEVSYEV